MVKGCKHKRRLIFAVQLALFTVTAIMAAVNILLLQGEYAAAEQGYAGLRQHAPATGQPASGAEQESPAGQAPATEPEYYGKNLSEINPDYIGWLRIEGTKIDYPVVRGQYNSKYLDTTFTGEKNSSGKIFMDSVCTEDFKSGFAILHGHNRKDGSMFAGLNRYLEDGYLEGHSEITVLTAGGQSLNYRIFSVKKTDVYDKAYTLAGKAAAKYLTALDAPKGANVLALSTCTNGGSDNERLLVFAAAE